MTATDTELLRKAFTGLLACPVLDSRTKPELWTLVRHPRHRQVLAEWFANRLGYRLVVTDAAARVVRTAIGGLAVSPRPFDPPPRRVLVLALLAAVGAEDADDVTTTQDLSDRARVLSQHDEVEVATYDPDRYAERLLFVKAIGVLVSVGALRPTTKGSADELDDWANHLNAVGGAYEVQRELLLRMVEPAALKAALDPDRVGPDPGATARHGVMRRLIELPALLYEDLTEAETAYLSGQRSRVLGWCVEMTGWAVEQRREGIALIASDEEETDLPFPRLRALDFVAISILDILLRDCAATSRFSEKDVRTAAAEVRARYPKAPTKDLATDAAMAHRALEVLCALDLVRPDVMGAWRLMPVAHRFRHPTVFAVSSTQLDLEEAGR
jgi:uncharacterized protein (TIGR02678 family)